MNIFSPETAKSMTFATRHGLGGEGGSATASPDECPGDAVVFTHTITGHSVRSEDGDALESVLAHREAQIRQGYTPEQDDKKSVWEFTQLIRLLSLDLEQSWPAGRKDRLIAPLRRCAVKVAATCLALIERIDRQSEN